MKIVTSRRADRKTKKESYKNKNLVTLVILKSKSRKSKSTFYTFRKSFFQILQERHDEWITTKSNASSSSDELLSNELWFEERSSIEFLSLESSSIAFIVSELKRQIQKKVWQQLFKNSEKILVNCINNSKEEDWLIQSSIKIKRVFIEQKKKDRKIAQEAAWRNWVIQERKETKFFCLKIFQKVAIEEVSRLIQEISFNTESSTRIFRSLIISNENENENIFSKNIKTIYSALQNLFTKMTKRIIEKISSINDNRFKKQWTNIAQKFNDLIERTVIRNSITRINLAIIHILEARKISEEIHRETTLNFQNLFQKTNELFKIFKSSNRNALDLKKQWRQIVKNYNEICEAFKTLLI